MPKIEIVASLIKQIKKQFSREEANNILDLLHSVEEQPHKGKNLGTVGGILIKELKYKNFRFYFIVDGHALRAMTEEELTELLLRFVRMSNKKKQQETIEEIKRVLRDIGPAGLT